MTTPYGNGHWAPGTAVHAKLNGGEHSSQTIAVDSAWHTWRVQWDDAGMRFWKDYVAGAQPYFDVPAGSLPDWQFNDPVFSCLRSWTSRYPVPGRRSRSGFLSGGHAHRLGPRLVATEL